MVTLTSHISISILSMKLVFLKAVKYELKFVKFIHFIHIAYACTYAYMYVHEIHARYMFAHYVYVNMTYTYIIHTCRYI